MCCDAGKRAASGHSAPDEERPSALFFFPRLILKLAASRFERIADRDVAILVRAIRARLAAHRDVGRIGNHEMNSDVKDVALVMATEALQ